MGTVVLAVTVLVVAYLGLALVGVVTGGAGHVPRNPGQIARSFAEAVGSFAQMARVVLAAAGRRDVSAKQTCPPALESRYRADRADRHTR